MPEGGVHASPTRLRSPCRPRSRDPPGRRRRRPRPARKASTSRWWSRRAKPPLMTRAAGWPACRHAVHRGDCRHRGVRQDPRTDDLPEGGRRTLARRSPTPPKVQATALPPQPTARPCCASPPVADLGDRGQPGPKSAMRYPRGPTLSGPTCTRAYHSSARCPHEQTYAVRDQCGAFDVEPQRRAVDLPLSGFLMASLQPGSREFVRSLRTGRHQRASSRSRGDATSALPNHPPTAPS